MKNERIERNLRAALETMQHACGDALRAIEREDEAEAIQRVFHALSWGFANAGSSIQSAMAALEDAHQIEKMT